MTRLQTVDSTPRSFEVKPLSRNVGPDSVGIGTERRNPFQKFGDTCQSQLQACTCKKSLKTDCSSGCIIIKLYVTVMMVYGKV